MSINKTTSPQLNEFRYGRSTLEYELIYEDRKNLAITVRPDKSIVVKVPPKSSAGEIQAKLEKRGRWILKQINYFDKFHPIQPDREYVSGETHYYLGRQYRLRIKKSGNESVKLIGKFFIVESKEPENREYTRSMMNEWYADHAKLLLDRRTMVYAKKILSSDYGVIEITYKNLKRRWGSYNPDGSITFNIELVKTPINCVDYVIVHELCHILHPNHDKAFYRTLSQHIPGWPNIKEKLEIFGAKQ